MPHAPHIHRWYCTASWQRRRAHQLMIEPLCRLCLEAGRVVPATVADHVTPHRGDYNAFRLGQLRSLCADCHNKLDANNAPRYPVREDGTPSDPKHPWNAKFDFVRTKTSEQPTSDQDRREELLARV